MVPLDTLDSFVQISFAVDTVFGIYARINRFVFDVLDGTVQLAQQHATAIALKLDDANRGRVETYTQQINSKTALSKQVHSVLAIAFRAFSFLAAGYCILLLHRQEIPQWFTESGLFWMPISRSWLLISPFPLYLFVTFLIGLIQLALWGYKICRLNKIAKAAPPIPPFTLPVIPEEQRKPH